MTLWWIGVGVTLFLFACLVWFLIEVVRAPLYDSYGNLVNEELTDDDERQLLDGGADDA